jgi:hypothetical protein
MKRSIIPALVLCSSFTIGACTKQKSQQPATNSTQSDARSDISNQPNPTTQDSNASGQQPVTVNPNSERNGPDSTLGTQQGAAVVGGSNMNPSSDSNVPTSVDTSKTTEPRSDAAVNSANCQDAIANDNNGKAVGKTNNCPPSSTSTLPNGDVKK